MSSRSKTNPGGKGRCSFRRRSKARSRLRSRLTSKAFSPATRISILSPSFSASASTTAAGKRMARLFPHFETCIVLLGYTLIGVCLWATHRNDYIYDRPEHHSHRAANQGEPIAPEQSNQSHYHWSSHHINQSHPRARYQKRARHFRPTLAQLPCC